MKQRVIDVVFVAGLALVAGVVLTIGGLAMLLLGGSVEEYDE